ncbi:hypothetical protein LTR36_006722 [Oleoguttula mirabilis]|uniref:Uncharacterized protein n=1 Tax=Oleoguttula mirabilis TaxID=1507867 RepID=A0AAV9JBN5_9PEZI|nr:hypothetical protein LTR36_006722 [Oleoguttula mirabilis]
MTDQVKYTQKLKDAKVLVIGGSSGIGYGVAEALVEHGAIITISSSNPDRVQKTVDSLKKSYPSATERIAGHACNLGDQATVESNIKELFEKVGKLDHVVYTAGDSLAMMPLESVSMEKMVQAGMVRFFAPLLVAKYAPKYLSSGPKSSITLTTGSVSERPMPDWSVIGSFATGLQGMCRGLALDLKPIRVNLISPGAIDTELWGMMSDEQKANMFKGLSEKHPTGKVGSVQDVVYSYLGAIQDYNMTGSTISTNSGTLLV